MLRSTDPHLLGAVYLARLNAEVPGWKRLASVSIRGEGYLLVDSFSRIIAQLDQPEAVGQSIRALAATYLPTLLSPQQTLQVGRALLWTLQQGLGNDWTPTVEQAWRDCYIELSQLLR